MSLSTILALLDPKHAPATLKVAELAAAAVDAPIRCVAIRPEPTTVIPIVGPGAISADVIQLSMENAEIEGKRHVGAAKDAFDAWSGAGKACFFERVGLEDHVIAEEGRVHGLLALPCGGLAEGETDAIYGGLFATGRPVLIAPSHVVDGMGEQIVIFWKDTPQAAKAVWSAMPFLKRAKRVTAISIAEDEHTAPSLSRLKAGLGHAGVAIETDSLTPAGDDAHDQLIEKAADLNADLVVMGAFSHSRLREFVLGGVTRATLQTLARPTFMAH